MLSNPSPLVSAMAADRPSVGEYVPSRDLASATASITAGAVQLSYFTADKTEDISNLTVVTGSTAAAATPTVCKMAVFSVSANGDLTQVGVTANDTALFAAPFTQYAKALTAPFTKYAGQRYATALIVVTGAAVPNFVGAQTVSATAAGNVWFAAPALAARWLAQTDMPTSITAGSLSSTVARVGFRLT